MSLENSYKLKAEAVKCRAPLSRVSAPNVMGFSGDDLNYKFQ